jgi:hypothetical protein
MNASRTAAAFARVRKTTKSKLPIPMNKQKGNKRQPAYLTRDSHMLIEANAGGLPCDYDPRTLTTFTREGSPLRTLARRIDGAFPSPSTRSRYGRSRSTTTRRHSEVASRMECMRPCLTAWNSRVAPSEKVIAGTIS